jgi:hypothetical protein
LGNYLSICLKAEKNHKENLSKWPITGPPGFIMTSGQQSGKQMMEIPYTRGSQNVLRESPGIRGYVSVMATILYLFLTAIGLTAGGSSTAHIYTQTVHIIHRTEHT